MTRISENSRLGQETPPPAAPPVETPDLMAVILEMTIGAFAVGFLAQIAKGLGSKVVPYELRNR